MIIVRGFIMKNNDVFFKLVKIKNKKGLFIGCGWFNSEWSIRCGIIKCIKFLL